MARKQKYRPDKPKPIYCHAGLVRLGELLREQVGEEGTLCSQNEFAQRIGASPNTIGAMIKNAELTKDQFEKNVFTSPSVETVLKVADNLIDPDTGKPFGRHNGDRPCKLECILRGWKYQEADTVTTKEEIVVVKEPAKKSAKSTKKTPFRDAIALLQRCSESNRQKWEKMEIKPERLDLIMNGKAVPSFAELLELSDTCIEDKDAQKLADLFSLDLNQPVPAIAPKTLKTT